MTLEVQPFVMYSFLYTFRLTFYLNAILIPKNVSQRQIITYNIVVVLTEPNQVLQVDDKQHDHYYFSGVSLDVPVVKNKQLTYIDRYVRRRVCDRFNFFSNMKRHTEKDNKYVNACTKPCFV